MLARRRTANKKNLFLNLIKTHALLFFAQYKNGVDQRVRNK